MVKRCLVSLFAAGLLSAGCGERIGPAQTPSAHVAAEESATSLAQPDAVIELVNTVRRSKTEWIAREHPRGNVRFSHEETGLNPTTDCKIIWEHVATWNGRDVYVFTIGDPNGTGDQPLEVPVLTGRSTVTVYDTPALKLIVRPQ